MMTAGIPAKRWASALAAPLVVLAVGVGLVAAGAHPGAASQPRGTLAQGCYQPAQTPGLYNPPYYGGCPSGPYIKPQGWPPPKPQQNAPK